ncbi:MAG: hypothetical protein KGJ11_02660, partial [Candidatus Omnitrophica bacterium]|nr:hypothetical protein [Candidatus Omnitrophota bacterium]
KFQEEMDRFKSIDHAQISQAPVLSETRIDSRPGGIDLSQTSDKILFQKSDAARAGGSFLVSQVLKSFKGFDFQVIEYRQISNPLSSLEGGL